MIKISILEKPSASSRTQYFCF